jgi:diguanylate cyclase (GGDEF)-like protein/PAS domain S-box-containing protein
MFFTRLFVGLLLQKQSEMKNSPNPISIRLVSAPDVGAQPEALSYENLLDGIYDGVYFVDRNRRITYWNKGAENLTGYTRDEVVGRHCFDNILSHVNSEGCNLCVGGCLLTHSLRDGERREDEVYLQHKLGHRIPVSVRISPLRNRAGQVIGAIETFSDISAKKIVERRAGELEQLVFRDVLTGVSNRRYMALRVEQALQEVQQFGRQIGLILVDLDHFKEVNDTLGHETGDRVLKMVCNTLGHNLRHGDHMGRWGGDEFVLIAMDVAVEGLSSIAARYCKLIAESAVSSGEKRAHVTCSMGATQLRASDTAEQAIARADELMYRSKQNGRNRETTG